jgi:hypothetical protein
VFRRRALLALALAALVVSSGCLGFLAGSEPLEFAADPARTDAAAAADAGYDLNATETLVEERTVEAAGQSRTVEVTSRVATYERAVELGPLGRAKLGVFAVVSSPAVEVAGQTFNPLADASNGDLVGMVGSQYSGLSTGDPVSSRSVQALGTTANVTKFAGTAVFAGQSVDVFVHVTKVRHGDDFVVAVGVYPRRVDDADAVVAMVRALEHPA